jgi:hypothetical protein
MMRLTTYKSVAGMKNIQIYIYELLWLGGSPAMSSKESLNSEHFKP